MTRGRTILKFDETIFKKPEYWGKICMYNSPQWDILFPIVNLIRIFPKYMIIGHTYTKNQNNIKLYGTQYNHLLTGIDLKTKKDYIENLKTVKYIFIFSDGYDIIANNLINYCEKTKTNMVCYSDFDKMYHFYDYTDLKVQKFEFNDADSVILKMEEIKEKITLNKLDELFPELEILDCDHNETKRPVLQNCIKILKNIESTEQNKKVHSVKIPFDANFNKLKKIENNRKKISYDDELPIQKPQSTKSLISHFFKK